MSEVLAHANIYTEEDYDNLPENVRAELIDGQIYYMAAPSRVHQEILNYMKKALARSTRPPLPSSCFPKMTKTWWSRISA